MSSDFSSSNNDSDLETKTINLLKAKGLSVTTARKLVLSLLLKEPRPFSAEEIFKKLPTNSCDQATVYRCVNQFVESQLVSTVHLEKEMVHFEFNDPNHHYHHIICKICKNIDSFHDCIMDKIETSLLKKGYIEIQHRLEFFAICENCQKGIL
ncbi:MAG: transcriptional repressor [Alphaproteobacteria bacterium]|nr:MAG: transcriptional repressor [Alphaproteobacteria bacterium]